MSHDQLLIFNLKIKVPGIQQNDSLGKSIASAVGDNWEIHKMHDRKVKVRLTRIILKNCYKCAL